MPWLYELLALRHSSSSDLEGAYYIAGFLGVISFTSTAPLMGIILGRFIRDATISFWAFVGLVFLVGLPALIYQVFGAGSLVSEFMTGGPWRLNDMTPFVTQATVITISVYALYAFVLYWQAKRGTKEGIVAAVSLATVSLVIIVLRFLRI